MIDDDLSYFSAEPHDHDYDDDDDDVDIQESDSPSGHHDHQAHDDIPPTTTNADNLAMTSSPPRAVESTSPRRRPVNASPMIVDLTTTASRIRLPQHQEMSAIDLSAASRSSPHHHNHHHQQQRTPRLALDAHPGIAFDSASLGRAPFTTSATSATHEPPAAAVNPRDAIIPWSSLRQRDAMFLLPNYPGFFGSLTSSSTSSLPTYLPNPLHLSQSLSHHLHGCRPSFVRYPCPWPTLFADKYVSTNR